MVYTSVHLSLAILEVLVHLEVDFEDLPDDYVSVEIDIPDNVDAEELKVDIDVHNIAVTQDIGDRWLTSAESVLLNVPSAVVPKERNLCINPTHVDFQAVQTVEIEPFQFDPRLFEYG